MEETLKNLTKAFIGESMARNRYTMYAKIAKKEGFEQIAAVFDETASQEAEHAKWLLRHINEIEGKLGRTEKEVAVDAAAETTLGTTVDNLKAAIAGETYEYSTMYPDFADKAQEDGLSELASRLRAIAVAETHHEQRYTKLLEQVEAETAFKKDSETEWVCRKCGYQHKGTEPPGKCPACNHPTAYYQIKCETY